MDGATRFEGWGSALRRRQERPGARFMLGSVLLHMSVVAAGLLASVQVNRDLPEFVQYQVRLVSPPPTEKGPPTPVEQTTAPVVTPPKPTPDVKPVEKQPAKTQAPLPQKVESKPKEAKPATGENPKPGPVGGEDINIAMEGQEFPYPDYLNRIVLELHRYFRWNGAPNLTADVVFYIRRDGSVGGIDVVRGSGNFRFDLQAIEAVEQAGRAKAFGALPDDWQGERLYIKNTFAPR